MGLHDHPAEGVGSDGTASREQAEMPHFHEALGQAVREEAAAKFNDVKGGVRGRALPTFREVKVTGRSVSATMRRLEMATLKTYEAREVKDVGPLGLAWLGPFQLVCQTRGSICARSPA